MIKVSDLEGSTESQRNRLLSQNQSAGPSTSDSSSSSTLDDNSASTTRNLQHELHNLPPVEPIQLSFTRKITVASGHILNDLCASLWFSYLLLYLQKVIEFDKSGSNEDSRYAAGLMFLGQIVDGLATPLVGYEADRDVDCGLFGKNYGRCKSWHLVGVILVTLSFPFVFSPCIGCTPETSDWAKLIYYSPFIVIFQIGWASTQISHLALIPKMHPDKLIRTELLAMRYAFTVGSNVIVFLMTWFTLGNTEDCKIEPNDADNFMKIALIAVGIGAVLAILFHIYVEEESDEKVKSTVAIIEARQKRLSEIENELVQSSLPDYVSEGYKPQIRSRRSKSMSDHQNPPREEPERIFQVETIDEQEVLIPENTVQILQSNARPSSATPTIEGTFITRLSTQYISLGKERMSMRDWLTLPQFYLVAFIYLSTRLSMNLSQVYVPLYLQDSLKLPCRTVATVPLTMYLSGFTVSLFVKVLNKHLGRQLAYMFGTALLLAGSLLIYFLSWEGPHSKFFKEYVIYGVAALLGGGASAILVTSLSITADLIGNNIENGAFVYGAMSFCDKLSCGFAVLIISALVPCSDEENPVDLLNPCDQADNVPFYRNLLSLSAGGCAVLGVVGIILLTVRIHIQNRIR